MVGQLNLKLVRQWDLRRHYQTQFFNCDSTIILKQVQLNYINFILVNLNFMDISLIEFCTCTLVLGSAKSPPPPKICLSWSLEQPLYWSNFLHEIPANIFIPGNVKYVLKDLRKGFSATMREIKSDKVHLCN